jgi:protein tyrosine phosphatase (PTP) superfamily phosphohydrolase (DUF442 family)
MNYMLTNPPDRFSLINSQKPVYRGAQPTHDHLKEFYEMGIRNVVNLRRESPYGNYQEKNSCTTFGINYNGFPHFGVLGMSIQTINQIVDAIHNMNGPVYVHCKHGRDRTSVIIASYLVKYCGKDPELAWKEDALAYDHDENSYLTSYFKPSFFDFCADLMKNKKETEKEKEKGNKKEEI